MTRSRNAWTLAALLLASACANSGKVQPAHMEVQEGGFIVTQEADAGPGARSDFAAALEALDREEYQRGIALLVEVTAAAPQATTAHIDLGMAYRQVDDLEQAEASLVRALELNPRHPVALNELGIVQRRTGRFQQARESYEKALAVYPEFHFARKNLAILCDVFLADSGCALEHYERYAQSVPEDETAAMWIADLRNRMGDLQ